MNLRIRVRPEAESDIAEAAHWYEEQRPGLGHDFLDELLSAYARLAESTNLYPAIYRNIRRLLTGG